MYAKTKTKNQSPNVDFFYSPKNAYFHKKEKV